MENKYAVGGIMSEVEHRKIIEGISLGSFDVVSQEDIENIISNMVEFSKQIGYSVEELSDALTNPKPDKQFVGTLGLNGEFYRFTK